MTEKCPSLVPMFPLVLDVDVISPVVLTVIPDGKEYKYLPTPSEPPVTE